MGAKPQTIKVRGEGGAIQIMDVPPEGTHRRRQLDSFIARKQLEVLEGDYEPDPTNVANVVPLAGDDEGETEQPSERPDPKANKPVWEAYAQDLGIETKGLSKPQIIDAVAKHES